MSKIGLESGLFLNPLHSCQKRTMPIYNVKAKIWEPFLRNTKIGKMKWKILPWDCNLSMEPSLNLIPKIKWPCNPWKYLPNLELEEMHSNEFSGNYLCRYFRKSKFITKKSEIKKEYGSYFPK